MGVFNCPGWDYSVVIIALRAKEIQRGGFPKSHLGNTFLELNGNLSIDEKLVRYGEVV
jgi:hypothetical protein